jgi:uncharacterized protein YjbJ (UPF0337 family)
VGSNCAEEEYPQEWGHGSLKVRYDTTLADWTFTCKMVSEIVERKEKQMKPSTKDQIKGELHELKGKVKEKAGKITDNPKLTAEGQDENLLGKVQKKAGQVEKVIEK